jgi:hypothetical protein
MFNVNRPFSGKKDAFDPLTLSEAMPRIGRIGGSDADASGFVTAWERQFWVWIGFGFCGGRPLADGGSYGEEMS